jgi:hypothetical protein
VIKAYWNQEESISRDIREKWGDCFEGISSAEIDERVTIEMAETRSTFFTAYWTNHGELVDETLINIAISNDVYHIICGDLSKARAEAFLFCRQSRRDSDFHTGGKRKARTARMTARLC